MNRTRFTTGVVGFVLCCGVSVPLAQHLSVAFIQLQIRDRFISERQSLAQIGHDFDVSPVALARALGIATLAPNDDNIPLARLAKDRGLPLDVAKARIADIVFPLQFSERQSERKRDSDADGTDAHDPQSKRH